MNRIPLPQLAARRPDAHKGDFGRVLVIGGSEGMVGAACLATLAALRAGAGLATLAIARSLLSVAAAKLTSALTHAIDEETENAAPSLGAVGPLAEFAAPMSAVALGPGIGRHCSTERFVHSFLARCAKPMVVDADGLNALAAKPEALLRRQAATVLTPHPGEMARLCGRSADEVNRDRVRIASDFASRFGCIVILKGHRTVIADGRSIAENETGNPGMATGGTGDVLTGTIVSFLAQGLGALEAARLGVHVHGLAGDIARDRKGEAGMIAGDVLRALPKAIAIYMTRTTNE